MMNDEQKFGETFGDLLGELALDFWNLFYYRVMQARVKEVSTSSTRESTEHSSKQALKQQKEAPQLSMHTVAPTEVDYASSFSSSVTSKEVDYVSSFSSVSGIRERNLQKKKKQHLTKMQKEKI